MRPIILTGGRVLDPAADAPAERADLLLEDGRVAAVGDVPAPRGARRIAVDGLTLLPGLIDAHVHVVAERLDLWSNITVPSSLAGLRAARVMRGFLERGFTTLRDMGGADLGLVMAMEEGLIDGPRLVICGKALTVTGGHSDLRRRFDDRPGMMSDRLGSMGVIADGVDAVRTAARTQLKQGAAFLKVMANGGVSSPNDPIHVLQYSRDELAALVEEARNAGTYVAAHVYTDAAIRRCVEAGVHSLEHCNLIEPATAAAAAAAGCIAVPTLVAYEALAREGRALGLGPAEFAKIDTVRSGGLRSLAVMREAGLPMAFGSDLLGELRRFHGLEFALRAEVLEPRDILRAATVTAARLCGLEGRAGTLAPGALADVIAVRRDPLADIAALGDPANVALVVCAGRVVKRAR